MTNLWNWYIIQPVRMDEKKGQRWTRASAVLLHHNICLQEIFRKVRHILEPVIYEMMKRVLLRGEDRFGIGL